MELITLITVFLLGYQVFMPAVDNAKYTVIVYENKLLRMNTQNGEFEVCDKELKCEKKK